VPPGDTKAIPASLPLIGTVMLAHNPAGAAAYWDPAALRPDMVFHYVQGSRSPAAKEEFPLFGAARGTSGTNGILSAILRLNSGSRRSK
jgi:hypothetical protein